MTYTDCDDLDVEACDGCGREHCACDDDCPEDDDHCAECAMYGDYQCAVHGDAVIAAQRAEWEHHATLDALRTLVGYPDAHASDAWRALVGQARRVLAEIEPPSPCDDRDPAPEAEDAS